MTSTGPLALVVTSSVDRPNYEPVARHLREAGLRVRVFEADRVAAGADAFTWSLVGRTVTATIGAETFAVREVEAAWWRKPHWLGVERHDVGTRISVENEIVRLQEDIWDVVPDAAWLNRPSRLREANRRPRQLVTAAELGFLVPDTVVANSWNDTLTLAGDDDVIFKTLHGTVIEGSRTRALFTTRLDARRVKELEETSMPYPGLVQPYIPKRREWRVTVVESNVFAAAIYTSSAASDDWRKHQYSGNVSFVADPLPDEVGHRCIFLTQRLGLRFAAIDLIETPAGDFVFLELNPNGQYYWLELDLGLKISHAIAESLVRIAQERE